MTKFKPITIGVEEECTLIDQDSQLVVTQPPPELIQKLKSILGDLFSTEVLTSQIETKTNICHDIGELKTELHTLRSTISDVANSFHLTPLFTSTHPLGKWREQVYTKDQKYLRYARDFQRCEKRAFVCGMHIHVGIEDDDLRIQLLNEMIPYLSYFLALTASSPFWNGDDTGLQSYRITILHDLPRTGLPPIFKNANEYWGYLKTLDDFDIIRHNNEVWWDIRPNVNHNTLELRICDVCPHIEDAIAVSALYQCLIHMLIDNHDKENWKPHRYSFARENIWQAERHGFSGPYIQQKREIKKTHGEEIAELSQILQPYAKNLACEKEIKHLTTIMQRDNSAQIQKEAYQTALINGATELEALRSVISSSINGALLSKA
jgi:glutamate---cysteine ligase / carboxylate-amine ligase